jgi:hypothetical protein
MTGAPRHLTMLATVVIVATLALGVATAGGEAVLAITSGPSGLTNDPTPEFTWTAPDGATVECRVDAAEFAPCTSPHTAGGLRDGPHAFEIRTAEGAGWATDVRTFVLDTAAPELTLEAPEKVADTSFTFAFATEDGADTRCAVDGAALAPCMSPMRTGDLPNATHAVRVEATDAAGNATTVSRLVHVDAPPPETTITAGPDGETREAAPQFGFAASRQRSTFECSVDDGPFAPCASSHTLQGLASGAHTLAVRARDAAGNADPSPAVRDFVIVSCETTVTIGAVEAVADCFKPSGPRLVADGAVKINGLTFNALGDDPMWIDRDLRRISFGRIQLRMGPIALFSGEIEWTVPEGERVTLAEIDLATFSRRDAPPGDAEGALDLRGDDEANIAGFDLKGTAKLELADGRSELSARIELPKVFTDAEGNGLTGELKVVADNARGVRLDQARVTAPLALIGSLELHNLSVAFAAESNNDARPTCNTPSPGMRWEGHAEAVVIPTSNRARLEDVGVGFADGTLSYARATWMPSEPGYDLGNGVRVQRIGVSLCKGPPLRLEGRVGLTAIPRDDGTPALRIPDAGLIFTAGKPWTLRAEAPLATFTRDRTYTFRDLYLQYGSSGAVDFGGQLEFALALKGSVGIGDLDAAVAVTARAEGFVEGSRFNLDLSAKGCFNGTLTVGSAVPVPFADICPEVDGVVSSTGVAVCGGLTVDGKSLGRVGAGYKWGGDLDFMGGACDVGNWRVVRTTAAAATAGGHRSVVLGRGRRDVLLALAGADRPPVVVLRGPGGAVLRTPADPDGVVRTDRAVAFANRATRTTYVGLLRPRGGRWTATPAPGYRLRAMRAADVLAPARVSVRVSRRGRRARLLSYRIIPRSGQRVLLQERGRGVNATIAVVRRGGRGRLRFRPADGPGGARRIVAVVEQDGRPRDARAVGRYVAPPRARPAKPRAVDVVRRGTGVRVSWSRAARARRYGVRVAVSDGRRLLFLPARNARSVDVPAVARGLRVHVRLVGLLADNTAGAAAVASSTGSRRSRP